MQAIQRIACINLQHAYYGRCVKTSSQKEAGVGLPNNWSDPLIQITDPSLLQSAIYSHSVGETCFHPGTAKVAELEFELLVLTAPAEANAKANTGSIAFKNTFFISVKFWFIIVIYSFLQVFDPIPVTGRLIVSAFDNVAVVHRLRYKKQYESL